MITVNFLDKLMCSIGIHQGEWTKEGCHYRRYCIFCGRQQDVERHRRSLREYIMDGSCEMRVTCLDCQETKSVGIEHEQEHWWSFTCKRCGAWLDGGGGG